MRTFAWTSCVSLMETRGGRVVNHSWRLVWCWAVDLPKLFITSRRKPGCARRGKLHSELSWKGMESVCSVVVSHVQVLQCAAGCKKSLLSMVTVNKNMKRLKTRRRLWWIPDSAKWMLLFQATGVFKVLVCPYFPTWQSHKSMFLCEEESQKKKKIIKKKKKILQEDTSVPCFKA